MPAGTLNTAAAVATLLVAIGAVAVLYMRSAVSTRELLPLIERLLRGGKRAALVNACADLPRRTSILASLALLGMRLEGDGRAAGDAPEGSAFATRARARSAEVLAPLRRWQQPPLVLGTACGLLAALFGTLAWLGGPSPEWIRGVAPVGLAAAILTVARWRRSDNDINRVVDQILPMLQPDEELSDDDRQAADRAAAIYRARLGGGQRP